MNSQGRRSGDFILSPHHIRPNALILSPPPRRVAFVSFFNKFTLQIYKFVHPVCKLNFPVFIVFSTLLWDEITVWIFLLLFLFACPQNTRPPKALSDTRQADTRRRREIRLWKQVVHLMQIYTPCLLHFYDDGHFYNDTAINCAKTREKINNNTALWYICRRSVASVHCLLHLVFAYIY